MRVRTVYALVAHHRTGSMTLNTALDNDSEVRHQAGNCRVLARRCPGSRWAAFFEDGSRHCDYRK